MKPTVAASALAVLLALAPGRCFALWEIAPVTPAEAKELGLNVRSSPSGPQAVTVTLELKPEGKLQNFSGVELRVGTGTPALVSTMLREDRSKPGLVSVYVTADRTRLDQLTLWVMVRQSRGGVLYELHVKDFVDLNSLR